MKTASLALLLMASMAFVVMGCSDNSAPLVSPAAQSAQTPVSLEKCGNVVVSFSLNSVKGLTGEGKMWYAGGKLHMKKFGVSEAVETSEKRVAGMMKHYLSLTVDLATGEGPCHGSFTIMPDDPNVKGVWEGTYEGYRHKTKDPYAFALPLKAVGHGKGGTINKMKLSLTITLKVITSPTNPPAPPQVPIFWSGDGLAVIK
jgi:hypothetical protein